MAKWNRKLNLTALQLEPASTEAIDRLLIEPAVASQSIEASDSLLIDVGSGGGSPAIPLKLCAPGLGLVMVEAKARKAAFLRDVTRQLDLKDVEVANSRLEELLATSGLNGRADLISMRAVRADEKLWGQIGALLSPRGRVLWFSASATSQPASASGLKTITSIPLPGTSRLFVLRSRTAS